MITALYEMAAVMALVALFIGPLVIGAWFLERKEKRNRYR